MSGHVQWLQLLLEHEHQRGALGKASGFRGCGSSLFPQEPASANSSNGAITLYSDGQGRFDSCVVTLVDTDSPAPPVTPDPPAPPADSNVLTNGGFETGTTGWSVCGGSTGIALSSDANTGSQAIQIAAEGCLYQEFSLQPDQEATLTCQAKRADSDFVSMSFEALDSGYQALASEQVQITNSSYVPATISLPATANSTFGTVTLYSEDTAHFDDCVVEVTSATDPAPQPDTPDPQPDPQNNLLVNADFETGLENWASCSGAPSPQLLLKSSVDMAPHRGIRPLALSTASKAINASGSSRPATTGRSRLSTILCSTIALRCKRTLASPPVPPNTTPS